MMALVYGGPGSKGLEEFPEPVLLSSTDALVRMVKTTICGTDLHIVRGDLPGVPCGRTLGHEGIGVIEEVNTGVGLFHKGDHLIVSCITSCGTCAFCRSRMPSHCVCGGWALDNAVDDTQAEWVRIPFDHTSLYLIPENADDDSMDMLSDILPTAYECGVLNGTVKPGDVVEIVGVGPVGLSALLTAQFFATSKLIAIDCDDNQLGIAKKLGATSVVNTTDSNTIEEIMAMTDEQGVDVAIEAAGTAPTFGLCQEIIGVGGHIAKLGVHGSSVILHLERLWMKNVTITTQLVDAVTTPLLLKSVMNGRLQPKGLVTHHFALGDILKAYETFGNASRECALKVMVTN
jgi:alcohol dehydrogenase